MNATDPSGFYGFHHLWRDVKPFVGAVIAIVATYLCNAFCGGSAWAWAGTLAGVGAVNGAIATGSLKGTVIGAFTGAIAGYAIGAGLGVVEAGLLNGVAGGIADQLQGGSFGHGFISAGAAAFFGGQTGQALGPIDTRNVALAFAQIAGRAIVGGTISAATGGKFSNGAISAAFSAAAEGVTAPNSDVAVTGGHGAVPANMTVVTPVFTDSNGAWLSQAFRTLNEALQAGEVASRTAAAAAGDGNEYGVATLVDQAGSFRNSSVVTSRSPEGIAWRLGPWRDQLVALNHLHPNNDLGFSQKDKDSYANWSQLKSFKGVFMFDGTGNHWYGPGREHWWGVDRTHSCGGAASSWSCDAEHPNWVK